MYADVESSAVCIGKERGLPSIEAECSLLGQPPSPANASGLPEGLTGDTVEQVALPGESGFFHTLFNAVNILCGVGLLATPYAAAQMGWLSLLLLFLLGCVFLYTGKLLGRCMAKASWILTYPDIGEYAFGKKGRRMVSIFLYAELYFSAVEFLIMEGDNLEALAPNFQPFGGTLGSAKQSWVLVAALILLPTMYLRNLSLLAYLSAAGVFTSLTLTGLVGSEGLASGFPNTDLPLLRARGIPLCIGLLSYNYGGHSMFPTLYTAMKRPQQYPRVLDVTFAIVCLLYVMMAVLGYLTFGDTVENNVTLSMQRRVPHAVATHIATWITILSPFTKYALTLTPIVSAIEELLPATASNWAYKPLPEALDAGSALQRKRKAGAKAIAVSLAVRTAMVASTVAVALSLPFFAYMAALIGGLFGLLACAVIPALCFFKISHGELCRVEYVAVILVIIAGIALSVVGTTNAILSMVHGLRD